MVLEKIKKKIVFSDYDGTIYINEEDMDRNLSAIQNYRDLGGKFVITTGRSRTSVNSVLEKYNIPFDYIIGNNGAIIFDNNLEKIYEETIFKEISDKIIEYLNNKQNIEVLFYDDEDKIKYYGQNLSKIRIRTLDYELARNIERDINNIFENEVKAHAAFPNMYYENSKHALIDIVSTKAGKEGGIKKILEMLNIGAEQAVTIGDGRNDIAMIKEYSGYSMETAEKEVKDVASKIFNTIADALDYLKVDCDN